MYKHNNKLSQIFAKMHFLFLRIFHFITFYAFLYLHLNTINMEHIFDILDPNPTIVCKNGSIFAIHLSAYGL